MIDNSAENEEERLRTDSLLTSEHTIGFLLLRNIEQGVRNANPEAATQWIEAYNRFLMAVERRDNLFSEEFIEVVKSPELLEAERQWAAGQEN